MERGPYSKKGDREDPGNYRGITLLSVVGKVFCKKLNRLVLKEEHCYSVTHPTAPCVQQSCLLSFLHHPYIPTLNFSFTLSPPFF